MKHQPDHDLVGQWHLDIRPDIPVPAAAAGDVGLGQASVALLDIEALIEDARGNHAAFADAQRQVPCAAEEAGVLRHGQHVTAGQIDQREPRSKHPRAPEFQPVSLQQGDVDRAGEGSAGELAAGPAVVQQDVLA